MTRLPLARGKRHPFIPPTSALRYGCLSIDSSHLSPPPPPALHRLHSTTTTTSVSPSIPPHRIASPFPTTTVCTKEKTEVIELPHCLVSCASLELLRFSGLSNCRLIFPKVMGFPALRVLQLTYVELLEDDDSIKRILESCQLLEDLSFEDCVLCKLDRLCISCPKFKRLSIINWEDVGCHGIEISCPILVDLDLTGHIACKFFFQPVDSLKKAVIEPKFVGNTTSVLYPGICRVEYLSIDLYSFSKIWNLGSPDPNFTLDAHLKGVNCVDYFTGGDKPYLITGLDDHTAKVCVGLSNEKLCADFRRTHTQNRGKIIWSKHNEIQTFNIKSVGARRTYWKKVNLSRMEFKSSNIAEIKIRRLLSFNN
ncbi:hypothetical protein LXL04_024587 [Taraxacum kok-saghyz]